MSEVNIVQYCQHILPPTPFTMHVLSWLPCLLLAAFALADADSSKVTELIIDTTFTPAKCPNKAQSGDAIQVHYVRSIYIP